MLDVGRGLPVNADAERLTQVMTHLLTNATHYTPPGEGRISVSARSDGDDIEIRIRDNGAGIAADVLPGIFDSDAQRAHVHAMLEASGKTFEELWRARAEANPARRYGRPDELGAYCAFLCSQHAGFITGQNLLIDGGSYPGTH